LTIHSPLEPSKITVTTFNEGCSRSDPGRSNAAGYCLSILLTSDVVVWTDGSAPSPLSAGGADVQAACRRCLSSSSLSYSAGPVSSSFLAESLALVHDLEWCHSHLKTCHFQSSLFVTDSQSALVLLSMAPAFIQPKSFRDTWNFSDSLFSRVTSSKLPVDTRSC